MDNNEDYQIESVNTKITVLAQVMKTIQRINNESNKLNVKCEKGMVDLMRMTERFEAQRRLTQEAEAETEAQKALGSQIYTKVLKALEEEFECPICMQIFIRPVSLSCSHVFCYHCIEIWEDQERDGCPYCRDEIHIQIRQTVLETFIQRIHSMMSKEVQDKREQLIRERHIVEEAAIVIRHGLTCPVPESSTSDDDEDSDVADPEEENSFDNAGQVKTHLGYDEHDRDLDVSHREDVAPDELGTQSEREITSRGGQEAGQSSSAGPSQGSTIAVAGTSRQSTGSSTASRSGAVTRSSRSSGQATGLFRAPPGPISGLLRTPTDNTGLSTTTNQIARASTSGGRVETARSGPTPRMITSGQRSRRTTNRNPPYIPIVHPADEVVNDAWNYNWAH